MKKALITGISGQDGSYLAELLLSKNYEVHGLIRRTSTYPSNLKNIQHILSDLHLHFGDLENEHHLCSLIHTLQPDELYHLASQSDVRISFDIPEYTANVTGLGTLRVLEAVRNFSPSTKIYYAASSEMFGNSPSPQNEDTPMKPRSPYAAAKLFGYNLCRIYREGYGMFICSGIAFNHESPRRGINFVTRKITKGIADIKNGRTKNILLGDISAIRDWGYARDYIEAFWSMLQQSGPDDYVLATGKMHSVEYFFKLAFSYTNLPGYYTDYIKTDVSMKRPADVYELCGDYTKAKKKLGWKPKVQFEELVKIMVDADLGEKE